MTDRPSLTLRATVGPEYTTGGESSVWTRNSQRTYVVNGYEVDGKNLPTGVGIVHDTYSGFTQTYYRRAPLFMAGSRCAEVFDASARDWSQ